VVDAGLILKVLHALAGMAFLSGLIGRWIILGHAARAVDIATLRTSLALSGRFERMVVVGSGVVLILGVATAIAQGRPFLGPLQGASIDWLFVSVLLYVSAIPLVPLVFLPKGRAFELALTGATERGAITEELRAAFADPVTRAAHRYELGAMLVIFVLMVAKPF
jgi:hypothetical protein